MNETNTESKQVPLKTPITQDNIMSKRLKVSDKEQQSSRGAFKGTAEGMNGHVLKHLSRSLSVVSSNALWKNYSIVSQHSIRRPIFCAI